MTPYPMRPKPRAPRPRFAFCGYVVTAQFARRPRVLRLIPSLARRGP